MHGDLDYLEPRVGQILRAPGTDLSTISAKRVRRQLLEYEPSLTPEYLKEHKEEIDAIIARVFEQVNAEQGAGRGEEAESSDSGSPRKRRHDDDDEGDYPQEDEEEEEKQARPPAKKSKKSTKNGQKITDEELARKLSNEINGRTTRTSAKPSGKGRATKGRSKKSSATVDSDGESDSGTERKSKKKSKMPTTPGSGGGAKGGFKKEFALSEPLAAVLETPMLARPQVVKQLWVYIKGNELQNPNNKREIMCDTKLKAVFGVDKIDMFTMNKVLGKHLHEPEESLA
ncbi:hypothetical protein D9611_003926 [Ephemerocybe angulata]|uniref:DM2 domain-containing protein n=1 Tax=Ephemerocybe angulata TaxID=980116 RepID=A0A8H5B5Z3_9AGAR|nr:hypothetical protein D9611_003926 [Tulosesus angulatus]